MADHIYTREDLIKRFDAILGKTLEEIDNKGMFAHVQEFNLQKGVVGTLIEQCVLGYAPDSKQEADLIVVDNGDEAKTELKSTGMLVNKKPAPHYVAKEPMSITAVGVYDLAEQEFWTSHFWNKLEHMLLVYYQYMSDHPVTPYEYRNFPIRGYEFHEFSKDEVDTLRQDWEHVRSLVERVVLHHAGPKDKAWKEAVKQEYIDVHGELRRVLSYIDLAPKFPPRFRLKKPVVSSMIAKHFDYQLEQLPGRYTVISDIDRKCCELTKLHKGKTIRALAQELGIPVKGKNGITAKSVAEIIITKMFGGTSSSLNQIELFAKFGMIAKSITMTPSGGRTEDMKLFHIDFEEIARETVLDEAGGRRAICFEDSEFYSYFADHEFLCVLFEEPEKLKQKGKVVGTDSLLENKFMGFKRLVFTDAFIDTTVRQLWEDTRDKVINKKLVDIIQRFKNGTVKTVKSGDISSAPNFMKSRENDVFIRGSGTDSSIAHKTECVNEIKMLPQYIWIKGTAIIDLLKDVPEL